MSWAAHDLEPYVIQKELGKRVAFVPLLVGSYAPDLLSKWFVYGVTLAGFELKADNPAQFHRGWPGFGFTHSLTFGVLVGLLLYLVWGNKVVAYSFVIGQWAHALTDIGDTVGTMLFFPFTDHLFSLGAWAYAGQTGRYTDAGAYFSGLGFVWDGVFVVWGILSWRVLTRGYFRTTVMAADPFWSWAGRYLSESTLVALYRASFFYGVCRWTAWLIWAHVVRSFTLDLRWGGPRWVPRVYSERAELPRPPADARGAARRSPGSASTAPWPSCAVAKGRSGSIRGALRGAPRRATPALASWRACELGRRMSGMRPSSEKRRCVSSRVRSLGGMTTSEALQVVVGEPLALAPGRAPHLVEDAVELRLVVRVRARPAPGRRARSAVARRSSSTRNWPSPISRTITASPQLLLRAAGGELGLELRELVVDLALSGDLRELAVERRLAGREVLEGARLDELVDGCRAGLHLLGLVLRALDREAGVGHLLADPGRRLADPHLRLGGRVLRLDDLLLAAEGLDLGREALLVREELLLLGLEPGDLLVEPLELLLGDRLALERRAREVLAAGGERLRAPGRRASGAPARACRVCSSSRFFAVTTSATPRLTFCSISSCFSYE